MDIENCAPDKYCKPFEVLIFHAILHDASGFFFEHSKKPTGYSYVLPCSVTNDDVCHVTSIAFCLYVKTLREICSDYWNNESTISCS